MDDRKEPPERGGMWGDPRVRPVGMPTGMGVQALSPWDKSVQRRMDSTVSDDATERYAQLIAELGRTVDPQEIDGLVAEAEQILADEAVIIPLMVHEEVGAAWWAEEVAGIWIDSLAGPMWNVAEWRDPLDGPGIDRRG